MAEHNDLGRLGEDHACFYLLSRDIHILARNWHGQDCELDIIAEDCGEIIFIEVKTRTSVDYGLPEDAVDANRMYRMSRAAEQYLYTHHLERNPFRFDIIALNGAAPPFQLRHIESAFLFKPQKAYHK